MAGMTTVAFSNTQSFIIELNTGKTRNKKMSNADPNTPII